MAKVIDANLVSSHGGPEYPWTEWFDGQCRELTMGVDIRGLPNHFRQNAYKQARYRGVRVVCVLVDDKTLRIQAFPKC